ncbi:hypothetical protein [Paraburkholderia sp. SUR17]|uniref:hypothetical protein n=1 Tax=Paraburkholderia sp. SUR17 TaxID=3034358 RepID=UPI0024078AAF|nr:hypothetical protein [Paraburkholderia sp. SUR17]WEY43290.1 hypothetical protein P2869_21980 [Paraburkholderia sp. SUR17]
MPVKGANELETLKRRNELDRTQLTPMGIDYRGKTFAIQNGIAADDAAHRFAALMQRIAALPDRSGVYTGNGDQFYFIEVMRQHNLLDEDLIDSPLLLNTPWFMRGPHSFIVHYFGMWTQMRALMMAHDDRRS